MWTKRNNINNADSTNGPVLMVTELLVYAFHNIKMYPFDQIKNVIIDIDISATVDHAKYV